jgi:hypothetical protein
MKYPIILLDNGNEGIETLDSLLTETNLISYKKKNLENHCYIIDSLGYKYLIKTVKKIKKVNPIWKFEFFDPMIEINVIVEDKKIKVDLDIFKKTLLKILNKDRVFWNSDGNLTNKITFINKASSFAEIIRFFALEGL